MLSKANIKFIKSLQIKKYRKQEQCFVVEGAKSVRELLASDFEVVRIFATAEFIASTGTRPAAPVVEVSHEELSGVAEFKTNSTALAIARVKSNAPFTVSGTEYALALDDIRDPGNLGTIIRTADWYGIRKIIASVETADLYNPKVIHATMGSFTRVQVYYTDLGQYLAGCKTKIYGAFLDGRDVHTISFAKSGVILVGNESHGISGSLETYVNERITIPRYGGAESLNAGIATAVILDNLVRNPGVAR